MNFLSSMPVTTTHPVSPQCNCIWDTLGGGARNWSLGGCSPSPPFPPLPRSFPFPPPSHSIPCPVPSLPFPLSPFPLSSYIPIALPYLLPFFPSLSPPFFRPFPYSSLPRSCPARGSGGALVSSYALPASLGRSPSRKRIWCILALKSDIWWQ